MRIAVIGSGGREHALLWRLKRDSAPHELFGVPGNGGMSALAENVPGDLADLNALRSTISRLNPDLVVVGPETPLAAGLADELIRAGISCFGPVKAAARLESSKAFAKRLMQDEGIPTADFEIFDDMSAVETFLRGRHDDEQWVVKADGLAAGKGAFVCATIAETHACAANLLTHGKLDVAGRTIILERRLFGREVSALFLCDGERFLALPPAQDYKRVFDGDSGPNTGGMGSYCPADHLTPELLAVVEQKVVTRVLRALRDQGVSYRGVLYVGLMLTDSGPQVIEFNCRFGDPETQVILPVWHGELAETLLSCAEGHLSARSKPPSGCAACVVLAADGYPDAYAKSIPLTEVPDTDHAFTLHAGTKRVKGELLSAGGRVLNAVGTGETVAEARAHAYELARRLHVNGLFYRSDIAAEIR
jgi:phosphoribosylamine---glycine ligase